MKLRLCVSGRLRKGPELTLFNKYLVRTEKIGKLINLFPIYVSEYDGVKWVKFLADLKSVKAFPMRSHKVLLDEKGKNFSSKEFANNLRLQRDDGKTDYILFVGGADGVPAALNSNFDEILSLGKMVWPHLLVRVMLMEQIYRASTILADLPYHKD